MRVRFRGKGYGAMAMREGIRIAREQYGADILRIEARCHAIGFYERFGFRVDSAEFLEDGIPHVEMVASLVP
ncbi:GNAT family N-acetyltransferase [Bifidobacterium pullorum]|uniref:GNAT family N-acetyltransferase n=1 Tax=Bifidobacterium pullorum TaxID=78448 RepID=UPI00195D6565